MKLAIRFGDNDFYNAFYGILEAIGNSNKWRKEELKDKEKLCLIINQISYGMYLLYQNRFEYNEEKSGNLCERTKNYLQIEPDQIYIDKEVDNLSYELTGDDNSETFVLICEIEFKPYYMDIYSF